MKKAPEHMAPSSRSLKNQKLKRGRERKRQKEMYLNDIQRRTKKLLEGSMSMHGSAIGSVLSKWRGSN
jgi:hypothetical protein